MCARRAKEQQPGAPPTKVIEEKQQQDAPAASAIVALCFVSAAHSYSLAAFFSYAGFLTVDLGWATDLDHSGVAVGMLGTALPLARIPFSIPWGMAMDRCGRRPCLVVTAVSLMLGQLLFPLMIRWDIALAVRFLLLGAGNGWPTVMGVVSSELGGPSRQAAIIGYVTGAGGLISLIGPGLGGYTYGLASSTFPALLPCLLGACLSASAALAVVLRLPETRPGPVATASASDGAGGAAGGEASRARPITLQAALCTYPLPLLVLVRCALGFQGFLLLALLPLWGIASRDAGGLALDNVGLGTLLSLAAGGGLLYSTLGLARLVRRLGVRRTLVCSSALQLLLVPNLPRFQAAPFALVVIAQCLVQMANVTSFSCTIAAVNNVCCAFPHRRGAVNGVMVTGESIAKAMGPGLGGPMFAWAISQPLPAAWPNGSVLYFGCLGILIAAVLAGVLALPSSVDQPSAPAAADGGALEMQPPRAPEGKDDAVQEGGRADPGIWTRAKADPVPIWVAPAGGDRTGGAGAQEAQQQQ